MEKSASLFFNNKEETSISDNNEDKDIDIIRSFAKRVLEDSTGKALSPAQDKAFEVYLSRIQGTKSRSSQVMTLSSNEDITIAPNQTLQVDVKATISRNTDSVFYLFDVPTNFKRGFQVVCNNFPGKEGTIIEPTVISHSSTEIVIKAGEPLCTLCEAIL